MYKARVLGGVALNYEHFGGRGIELVKAAETVAAAFEPRADTSDFLDYNTLGTNLKAWGDDAGGPHGRWSSSVYHRYTITDPNSRENRFPPKRKKRPKITKHTKHEPLPKRDAISLKFP